MVLLKRECLPIDGCLGKTELPGNVALIYFQINTSSLIYTLVSTIDFFPFKTIDLSFLPAYHSLKSHQAVMCVLRTVCSSHNSTIFRRHGVLELDGCPMLGERLLV